MAKKQLEDFNSLVETQLDKLKSEVKYFSDKNPEYALDMLKWFKEVATKNRIIHSSKIELDKKDEEMDRRTRSKVYYIDFGVNVGSEFNYPHFAAVIAEGTCTATIIPLSTKKDKDEGTWKEDSRSPYINIGEVKGFPYEDKECYALIGQIKTVSKKRLSDYRDKNKQYHELSLTVNQLNLIDENIVKHLTKTKKSN